MALIEYCSRGAEGNVYLHVIEGNNPDRVQRKVYPLDNSQVLGFGLCEDLVDTTMRSGNEGDKVLALQQNLYQLGFLDELHLTGAYGSHTRAAVMALQQEFLPGHAVNGWPTGRPNSSLPGSCASSSGTTRTTGWWRNNQISPSFPVCTNRRK